MGETINIRVSSAEKAELQRCAINQGLSLSAFLRSAAIREACRVLGPLKIVPNTDAAAQRDMQEVGG
jgi:uncharacterized protein (DUF1778 family)